MTDYYEVLGVPSNATTDVIRAAYRAKAKELHPDRNPGDPAAAAKFAQAAEAWAVLSDENKRMLYNAHRSVERARRRPPARGRRRPVVEAAEDEQLDEVADWVLTGIRLLKKLGRR